MKIKNIKFKAILLIPVFLFFSLTSCGIYKPVDARNIPAQAKDKARKNINEGKGVNIGSMIRRNSTFEFSTSNPLWRASLDVLNFMPLATVDYSGGIIITDWYNDNNNPNESIKISIRFLSNEVRADSVEIKVHKKNCTRDNNCTVQLIKSKIEDELNNTIIKKAALLEKNDK